MRNNTENQEMNMGIIGIVNPNQEGNIHFTLLEDGIESRHFSSVDVPSGETVDFSQELMIPAPCEVQLGTSNFKGIFRFAYDSAAKVFAVLPVGGVEAFNPPVILPETSNKFHYRVSLNSQETGILIVGTVDIVED
jgi:hypothetical protein